MRLNNYNKSVKIKSSGLCICTGTGSTSWNLSINRISRKDIHDILKLYITETNGKINKDFESQVKNVANIFNNRFQFGPGKFSVSKKHIEILVVNYSVLFFF